MPQANCACDACEYIIGSAAAKCVGNGEMHMSVHPRTAWCFVCVRHVLSAYASLGRQLIAAAPLTRRVSLALPCRSGLRFLRRLLSSCCAQLPRTYVHQSRAGWPGQRAAEPFAHIASKAYGGLACRSTPGVSILLPAWPERSTLLAPVRPARRKRHAPWQSLTHAAAGALHAAFVAPAWRRMRARVSRPPEASLLVRRSPFSSAPA
eukprot:351691-Chlamydomonas_euryale.AAC.6